MKTPDLNHGEHGGHGGGDYEGREGREGMAVITQHAAERLKQRLGWKGKAQQRMADRALKEGVKHAATRGALFRFLTRGCIEHRKGNNVRIFAEHVFIFQDCTLITVLHLPHEFHRAAQSATKKGAGRA